MDLKHKITINVAKPNGIRSPVLQSGRQTIRSKLLNKLFGEQVGLILITPGNSVETVEIRQVREGSAKYVQRESTARCSV